MGRAERVTEYIKQHDRKLFCAPNAAGTLCIWRKVDRLETYDVDGLSITFALPDQHLVTYLTDTWTQKGTPVEWGLLPIMDRIREIDLWANEKMVHNLIKDYEKKAEEDRKARNDKHEEFSEILRDDFKHSFGDHIVGSLVDKEKEKKRQLRKEIKNGY